jgi:predicted CoA-binding protein
VSNIIPIRPSSRADVDEAAVTEQVDQIPGELDVDRVIKAQLSAPQVIKRITELEDCLWAVTQELLGFDRSSAAAERARLLLKNRLEIGRIEDR